MVTKEDDKKYSSIDYRLQVGFVGFSDTLCLKCEISIILAVCFYIKTTANIIFFSTEEKFSHENFYPKYNLKYDLQSSLTQLLKIGYVKHVHVYVLVIHQS